MAKQMASSAKRPRISIDVQPELRRRLRLAAAKHDRTVQQYVLEAIEERLRKRRIEMELLQKHVASRLGTNEWTYRDWERFGRVPRVRFLPGIIAFLGYYPYPEPTTLKAQLLKQRRLLGYSHEQMGKLLSVNEATYRHWENGLCQPNSAHLRLIELLCDSHGS
jgi:DNA-binding transcriptional regulator YiaG